nr:MAG TPA: replisome organizer protein [Caudoviricetes sp.]
MTADSDTATGKRYYWLRLYDDFFTSKRIKKLRRMAGGDTYTIIYLKMQLTAMKNDGILKWTGLEDNIADELSLDLDESPDDIKVTLAFLLSCGLAETSDNISYYFPYSVCNVGSEGSSAKRMRDFRQRQKALNPPETSQCDADVTPPLQTSDGEKEIDKEIDKEKETDKDSAGAPAKPRHKYGTYQNVLLSDADYEKLKSEFPTDYNERIERVSEYVAMNGKKYKDFLAVIRNWARRDTPKEKPRYM